MSKDIEKHQITNAAAEYFEMRGINPDSKFVDLSNKYHGEFDDELAHLIEIPNLMTLNLFRHCS